MSIEYSVLIKEKKITEAILIKKLQLMGYSCNMIEKLSKGINIDLNEAIGFFVYLIVAEIIPITVLIRFLKKKNLYFNKYWGFGISKNMMTYRHVIILCNFNS